MRPNSCVSLKYSSVKELVLSVVPWIHKGELCWGTTMMAVNLVLWYLKSYSRVLRPVYTYSGNQALAQIFYANHLTIPPVLRCNRIRSSLRHNKTCHFVARLGTAWIEQEITPQCIKIRSRPILRGRTQESEPTTSKLAENLNVTASPCHVGDSQYSTIRSTFFGPCIPQTFISTRALAPPRTSVLWHSQTIE